MPVADLKRHLLTGSLILTFRGDGKTSEVYEPPNGEGFFERPTFHAGGRVESTFMGAATKAIRKRKGDWLTITNGGATQVFTVDDHECADAGGLLGRDRRGDGTR